MLGISAFAESPFAALAGAGPNAIVNVLGQAATGGVGTVALPETIAITGQSSTGAVGTTTLSGLANIVPTGQQSSALISGLGVGGSVIAILPSLSGTVGSVSVSIDGEANVSIPLDDEGEGQLGAPVIKANSDVLPTGQSATGGVGVITTATFNTVPVPGLSATTAVGTIVVSASASLHEFIVGMEATTSVGTPNIWTLVDDDQTAGYNTINTTQSASYSNVNDTQNPNWDEVA